MKVLATNQSYLFCLDVKSLEWVEVWSVADVALVASVVKSFVQVLCKAFKLKS